MDNHIITNKEIRSKLGCQMAKLKIIKQDIQKLKKDQNEYAENIKNIVSEWIKSGNLTGKIIKMEGNGVVFIKIDDRHKSFTFSKPDICEISFYGTYQYLEHSDGNLGIIIEENDSQHSMSITINSTTGDIELLHCSGFPDNDIDIELFTDHTNCFANDIPVKYSFATEDEYEQFQKIVSLRKKQCDQNGTLINSEDDVMFEHNGEKCVAYVKDYSMETNEFNVSWKTKEGIWIKQSDIITVCNIS